MDHLASFMSFQLVVILVVYASFLSPFAAEARPNKLVDQSNNHHHVKPPRPSTPKKAPPLPPPPPQTPDSYWPSEPLPPALPMPPASSPYYNGMALVPSSAPPQSSSPPPMPQSGDDLAAAPVQPPPNYPYQQEAETPDWTPPGYFPTNGLGGFLCGEGPCWDSQYCNLPCGYCSNHTCIVEPDFDYDYYYNNGTPPPQPSSPPLS